MSNRILSYKSLIGTAVTNNADIHEIPLSTRKGEVGYRIKQFALLPYDFGASTSDLEATVKIYKTPQTNATSQIDFSDQSLIAASVMAGAVFYPVDSKGISGAVIFENEIFNQDIYVTYYNNKTNELAGFVNYYLELEVIKLNESEAMVTTLKDIRNTS